MTLDRTSTPLHTLLKHAEAERDGALAERLAAQAALQSARAQHVELLDYRAEYERRYAAQFARGAAGIDIVRCYQGFMQRLAQAIEQQSRLVRQTEVRHDCARAALQGHELRVASIGKLIERRAAEQQRSAGRREQRLSDEAAARSGAAGRPTRPGTLALLGV